MFAVKLIEKGAFTIDSDCSYATIDGMKVIYTTFCADRQSIIGFGNPFARIDFITENTSDLTLWLALLAGYRKFV